MAEKTRCVWCGTDPIYVAYHDEEWGVPVHDDRTLFEFLILEGAQAGLSWITILKRRGGYRAAYENFDVEKVARYGEKDIQRLLNDAGIIRNNQKVRSSVSNAQAFIAVQEESGSFDAYIWDFVDGKPIQNRWKKDTDIPAITPQAEALSKDLKKRGFKFVGPTIMYAHMQATGMVNDHVLACFRYNELRANR